MQLDVGIGQQTTIFPSGVRSIRLDLRNLLFSGVGSRSISSEHDLYNFPMPSLLSGVVHDSPNLPAEESRFYLNSFSAQNFIRGMISSNIPAQEPPTNTQNTNQIKSFIFQMLFIISVELESRLATESKIS